MTGQPDLAGISQTPPAITIEDVRDMARLKEIEQLQAAVWREDDRMIVPAHLLHLIAGTGGIVLGAYHQDRVIGFVLGLLARQDGRYYHASHMAGVAGEFQGRGIGARLKQAQRVRALEQGLDLMTWTFDPLEGRNAYFNLHKLGAASRTYHVDAYGSMQDVLNRGLPSDRLLVEWRLRDVHPRPVPARVHPILTAEDGRPRLVLDAPPEDALSVAVPDNIQELKRRDAHAAHAWRLATREALLWAFARGYEACDFSHGAYLLRPRGSFHPADTQ